MLKAFASSYDAKENHMGCGCGGKKLPGNQPKPQTETSAATKKPTRGPAYWNGPKPKAA